jgi:hypothetical protein
MCLDLLRVADLVQKTREAGPTKGHDGAWSLGKFDLVLIESGVTNKCIVLFPSIAVVLDSNPFCFSSQEQNDSFSTQGFRVN